VKPEQEQEMVQEKHFDFAGQEIQETYDEWSLPSRMWFSHK
jgi:hypothetical protein